MFRLHYSQLDDDGNVAHQYLYSTAPDEDLKTATYADRVEHHPPPDYCWHHTPGNVVNALIRAGLTIRYLREFPFRSYRVSDRMVEQQPGRWVLPGIHGQIPYQYSTRADRLIRESNITAT